MTPAEIAFGRMAQEVSEAAANVDCTPQEYRDGLAEIISTLQIDLDASREGERQAE